MKRSILIVTVAIFIVSAATAGNVTHPTVTIPDTIASSVPHAKPVWVAADVAFDGTGHFRHEYFDDYVITMLDSFRASERDEERKAGTADCVGSLSSTGQERSVADNTVDDLAKNSSAILRGDVVSARQGFYFGQPGTLLAIQVASSLKRMSPVSSASVVYTFVQRARIDTPLGSLCANSFDAATTIPQVGDRLLLFAVYDPVDATHAIIPADVQRTVVIERAGQLRVPKAFEHLRARNLDDVVNAVKANPRIQDLPTRWEVQ